MGFKHKLSNGKMINVVEGEIYGLCEVGEITVSDRIRDKLELEVYIHELLHAEFEDWSEAEVDKRALSVANLLWKAGYRRKTKKVKKTKRQIKPRKIVK